MKSQVTTLANGLTIVSQKNTQALTFNIVVYGRFGSRHETPEQNGIAHFFEHMTFKGTPHRSELEIIEQIADTGGKSDAATDRDITAFGFEVMNDDRERIIELLSDLLLNSTFSKECVDSEREVIFQEMYEDENDDEDVFDDAFARLVYGKQSLGRDILGTKECLKHINRKDLLAWRKQYCCGENLIISAIGNFEHEELVGLIEKYFSTLEKGCKNFSEPQKYIGGFSHIKPTSRKVKLKLAFNLLCEEASLANETKFLLRQILGGEESSRLFAECRTKRSLVYYIYAQITNWFDTGTFEIIVGVQAKNVNKVLDVIIREVKKLMTELVSEKELERAKRQQIFDIGKKASDNQLNTETMAEQVVRLGVPQELDDLIAKINAVTPEDIQKTAQAIFATPPAYLLQGRIKSYYPYEELCEMLK